jgi:hypothetical protein
MNVTHVNVRCAKRSVGGGIPFLAECHCRRKRLVWTVLMSVSVLGSLEQWTESPVSNFVP